MIIDKISNINCYKGISDLLDEAIDIATSLTKDIAEDRYNLSEDLYYTVMTAKNLPFLEKNYEAHQKFIDLQVILDMGETVRFADIKDCLAVSEYNYQDDICFYSRQGDTNYAIIKENSFYIAFPQDAHMPCCKGEFEFVKKAVFKVRVK